MDPLEYEIGKWRRYADLLGLVKPEHAEKDYLQELLLSGLCSGKGGRLVFRGGTAISKFYGSGRFSEDLDFVLTNPDGSAEARIEAAIKALGMRYSTDYRKKAYRNMVRYDLKVKGPIYGLAGNEQAKQTVKVDVNTYERPLMEPDTLHRIPVYEDLGPYSAAVAAKEELLADKVKSIMERTRPMARDLYDAWLLARKYGLRQDSKLIRRKMLEYGKHSDERFSMAVLKGKIREIGAVWGIELSRLMKTVPDYSTVRKEFLGSF